MHSSDIDKRAIVIGTDYGREQWLANMLSSLEGCGYQILVLTQGKYELGKIKWVYDHTDIEEFLFLHDTMMVKRLPWIDKVFASPFSVMLSDDPCPFAMYMGKYQRKVLKHVDIPEVKTKEESVYYESHWTIKYFAVDPAAEVLWPGFGDAPADQHRYIEVGGRPNLVLENDDIIKYKGTWTIAQAQEIDRSENGR